MQNEVGKFSLHENFRPENTGEIAVKEEAENADNKGKEE